MELRTKLYALGLSQCIANTCDEDFLIGFLKQLSYPVITAIEIGTMNGIGTAALACVAKRVYTFDINLRNAEYVWNKLGVRHKISIFVGKDSEAIRTEIHERLCKEKNLHISKDVFNLAFVDGHHSREAVEYDFETVKFTNRVILHDMQHPPIGAFVTSIGGKEIHKHFGYWQAT